MRHRVMSNLLLRQVRGLERRRAAAKRRSRRSTLRKSHAHDDENDENDDDDDDDDNNVGRASTRGSCTPASRRLTGPNAPSATGGEAPTSQKKKKKKNPAIQDRVSLDLIDADMTITTRINGDANKNKKICGSWQETTGYRPTGRRISS